MRVTLPCDWLDQKSTERNKNLWFCVLLRYLGRILAILYWSWPCWHSSIIRLAIRGSH